jgi:hypothetical protein
MSNFTTYFNEYRDILLERHLYGNIYGANPSIQIQTMGARCYPFPDLPNDKIQEQQNALCGTLKVKQKKFTISKTGEYITDYDPQGRIAKYTGPFYVQSFTYYPDSIIEEINFTRQYAAADGRVVSKYDKNKNLLWVKMTRPDRGELNVMLCEREYRNGLLVKSAEMGMDLSHNYTMPDIFYISYLPGSSKVSSIQHQSTTWADVTYNYTYDEEEPGQFSHIGSIPAIYNLQGKLIELDDMKFNYYENGLLKSYVLSGMSNTTATYTYDEKGRVTNVAHSYFYDQDATYSYHDNGLLDKLRGYKVKYQYY